MKCRKSNIQLYECQVIHAGISFDACMAKELFYLWDQGIKTTGCCCGQHVNQHGPNNFSYIGVVEKDISKMKKLGYEVRVNEMDFSREDAFIPKTFLGNINGNI